MIALESFEQNHLLRAASSLGMSNIALVERTLHAFMLLDRLAASELNFIFKGGTSLLLHLESPKRLSVDVDIVCSEPIEKFERILNERVCQNPPFLRFEHQDRGAYRQPKRRHYKFFYPTSNGAINNELFVLLDVVEEECPLKHIIEKNVALPFAIQNGDMQSVKIPDSSALLADKLTAFAPHTIGVPYQRERGETQEHQVFKQLFDIGQLYSAGFDLQQVRENYFPAALAESGYRGGKFSPEDALLDVVRTAFDISCLDLSRKVFEEENLIRSGIAKMRANLVQNARFDFSDAKLIAAQAAYLAVALLHDREIEVFSQTPEVIEELRANRFKGVWGILDRLKRTNLKTYWYWSRIQSMLADWEPPIA